MLERQKKENLSKRERSNDFTKLFDLLEDMGDFDLYDVLAELGYGLNPRTRVERAQAFNYKHADWLKSLPAAANETLKALASQFAQAGTDSLENPYVFETPEVVKAGGAVGHE